MLATVALKKSKLQKNLFVEETRKYKYENIVELQIKYIEKQICYYCNNGYMKLYKQLYILPDVLDYFQMNGYTLCNCRISWKNATFGQALEINEIANKAFLQKVSSTMLNTPYCQKNGKFKFDLSYKHCKQAIELLEKLGYTIEEDGVFLLISFVDKPTCSICEDEIESDFITAIKAKTICMDKQIKLIDELIENDVRICNFKSDISDLKYILPDVRVHYITLGYTFVNNYITWDNAIFGKALKNNNAVSIDMITVQIESACCRNKTEIFLNYVPSNAVLDLLIAKGYIVKIYEEGVVVSWNNITDGCVKRIEYYYSISCLKEYPELMYDYIYRQCT